MLFISLISELSQSQLSKNSPEIIYFRFPKYSSRLDSFKKSVHLKANPNTPMHKNTIKEMEYVSWSSWSIFEYSIKHGMKSLQISSNEGDPLSQIANTFLIIKGRNTNTKIVPYPRRKLNALKKEAVDLSKRYLIVFISLYRGILA